MPKLIDYSARFEFLRQAAFTVVRDHGVAALSRHSVARALGTSVNTVRRLLAADAELVVLAADEVARRRRHGRFGRLREGRPVERALFTLRALLPDAEHRIDEELVWLKLTLSRPRPATSDEEGPLWQRWQLANQGWVEQDPGSSRRPDGAGEAVDAPADPVREHVERRRDEEGLRIAEALELLQVPQPAHDAEHALLRAVTQGLTLAVCEGRLTPDAAVTHLEHHLTRVEADVLPPHRVDP